MQSTDHLIIVISTLGEAAPRHTLHKIEKYSRTVHQMSFTIRTSIMSSSTLLRQCYRRPSTATSAFVATLPMNSGSKESVAPISTRRGITTYSQLPQEHQMVYDMCRKLADEVIAPNAKQWDKEHTFPTAAIHQLVR